MLEDPPRAPEALPSFWRHGGFPLPRLKAPSAEGAAILHLLAPLCQGHLQVAPNPLVPSQHSSLFKVRQMLLELTGSLWDRGVCPQNRYKYRYTQGKNPQTCNITGTLAQHWRFPLQDMPGFVLRPLNLCWWMSQVMLTLKFFDVDSLEFVLSVPF